MLAEKEQFEPLKTKRAEFSKSTKLEAFMLAGGRCADCGCKLTPDITEYDHEIPCGLGGDNSVTNCKCLCSSCHQAKTKGDVKTIAKTKRMHNKHHGIVTRKHKQTIPSRPFPGSRASGFKKKLDGSVVRRAQSATSKPAPANCAANGESEPSSQKGAPAND